MVAIRDGLAHAGLSVMTFNYPYTERGSKAPDRQDRLIECHRAAADAFSKSVDDVFLGGRSMGGRMATYLVADGYEASGLVLYAYPLHPAGKPEKLRVEQFPRITIPMLFLQGTRDALSKMELFNEQIVPLPKAKVVLLDGAGHGFRGGGWDLATLTDRYVSETRMWIDSLSSGESSE